MNVTTIPNSATAVLAVAANVTTLEGEVSALQATSGGYVIVRAGATPSGNLYASLASGMTAAHIAGPDTTVLIDGDVNGEAVAYNFTNARFEGLSGGLPTVTFPDGASAVWDASSAPRDFEMRNVAFVFEGTTAPFIDAPSPGVYVLLDLYSSISMSVTASKAFIHAADGVNVQLDVNENCSLRGASGRPAATPRFRRARGGTCQLSFGPSSSLATNTITGGAADAFYVVDKSAGLTAVGAMAVVEHAQTGATPVFDPP